VPGVAEGSARDHRQLNNATHTHAGVNIVPRSGRCRRAQQAGNHANLLGEKKQVSELATLRATPQLTQCRRPPRWERQATTLWRVWVAQRRGRDTRARRSALFCAASTGRKTRGSRSPATRCDSVRAKLSSVRAKCVGLLRTRPCRCLQVASLEDPLPARAQVAQRVFLPTRQKEATARPKIPHTLAPSRSGKGV
jgi:hypothetical protein